MGRLDADPRAHPRCSASSPTSLFRMTDPAVTPHESTAMTQAVDGDVTDTVNPVFDWHALAPDIVLTATILVMLVARLRRSRSRRRQVVAHRRDRRARGARPDRDARRRRHRPFDVRRRVRRRQLRAGAQGVLPRRRRTSRSWCRSTTSRSGDYYQGEFYFLLLMSTLGMSVMASARDLITMFVALETISIPTFILAAYRKHDRVSNEAGVKYYLIGVLSSALMLYGMSLIFGYSGSTMLSEISELHHRRTAPSRCSRSRSSCRSSGSRSRSARCRSTSGRPTPMKARRRRSPRSCRSRRRRAGSSPCSTSSSSASTGPNGVGRRRVVAGGLGARRRVDDARQPRRAPPDEHRSHAGVLVDRAGRVHARAVRGGRHRGARRQHSTSRDSAFGAVIVYLLIYGAMNLGAFAVVIAVARRTAQREIIVVRRAVPDLARALAVMMTIFLASLAGIPPSRVGSPSS